MIAFTGAVPENYDRYLGDILFAPFAADLSKRVGGAGRILEIACGTGVLTQAILERDSGATIVATDLNQGMIDVAQQKARSDRVTWRQADAMRLPFGDHEFDAVVCQFGFMFVPDKLAAFREARRVLRPDGLLAFNVWDSLAENDASRLLHEAVTSTFAADPPRFVEVPFSMHDRRDIERLLRAAGFRTISLTDVDAVMAHSDGRRFAIGMVRGSPLFDGIRERGGDHDAVIAAAERAITEYRGDLRMRAIVVEAR